jgi:hypothetical protein
MFKNSLIIEKNRITSAFVLITFLINELILENKIIPSPVNLSDFEFIDESNFRMLRHKIVAQFEEQNKAVLSFEESMMFYVYIDIACKCFVSDINHTLKDLSKRNMRISPESYDALRLQFLNTADKILSIFNKKYGEHDQMKKVKEKLVNFEL